MRFRVRGRAQSRHAFVDVHDFMLADLHHVAVVQVVAPHTLDCT